MNFGMCWFMDWWYFFYIVIVLNSGLDVMGYILFFFFGGFEVFDNFEDIVCYFM